ncbi:zinc-ribbon domain-containing protein [Ruegeria lacuscaerulensis]|uniref:zinc-ribbon domain-containing protein n=1 Tax=Ruegeria lacuscaerulensis TaxID=55218 RepID=UPI001481CB82|nr:zinc-ribbon domain-containing protein [Ruegeria lacuscaerulensis]
MRLTCPNCSAQYEVPDEVIPAEGRDVQCSNCEKTWFQAKTTAPEPDPVVPEVEASEQAPEPQPASRPAPQPEPEPQSAQQPAPQPEPEPQPAQQPAPQPEPEAAPPQPEPKPAPPPQPEPEPQPTPQAAPVPADTPTGSHVDPSVSSILKEEAAREADLRAQEAESLETQTDLALTPPEPKPTPEPEPEPDPEQAIRELTATEAAKDPAKKEDLPDVEAINSSLRSDEPVAKKKPKKKKKEQVQPLPRKAPSGGFRRGFLLMVVIGVILFLIYGNAQQISEAVPQADPVLDSYVSLVDQARLWLQAQTSSGAQ